MALSPIATRYCRVLIAAIGAAMALSACGEPVVEDLPDPIRPAVLLEVEESSNVRAGNFPAIIEATSSSELTFQVGGSLQEFPVIESQEVSRGEVIAQLDQREYRNSLAQARAQFESARSEFERAERLVAESAISRSVFEQRQSQFDVAKAALDSAQKAFDDTTLRSPFDGIVAVKHVAQFQNVAPQEPIVTLQTTGAAEAVVQFPATLVANSGRLTPLETVLELDAASGIDIPAEFYSVSTQADLTTQTYEARFAFDPPDTINVLPGMTGTIKARLLIATEGGVTNQVTVPLAAVLSEAGEQFVWVVDRDTMTVSKRAITLEANIGDVLAVESGLEPGETIVGAGASYLYEGMKIRPYEP